MPEIQVGFRTHWKDVAKVQAAVRLKSDVGARVQSVGSVYTRPAEPAEGIPTESSLAPGLDVPEQLSYGVTHAISWVDARDNAALEIASGSMELSDGSAMWSLVATGDASLAAKLRAGEQPAQVLGAINGVMWSFVVESIDEPQAFASHQVSIRGRSLAALADTPYQTSRQWTVDAPTTAAQISTLAQAFTPLEVAWQAPDWLIPAGAWSYAGSPLDVVRQCAQAIGADIDPVSDACGVVVRPRYAIVPNLWATSPPDWQIHWNAIERSTSEVVDKPAYDSVIVAGQQQGGILQARLAGASGATQAPMLTDPLLTDGPALVERATATLSLSGKQLRVSRTMQLGPQGLVRRGNIVRFVDPDETWCGMVRSVGVSWAFGIARQTIGVERRVSFPAGSVATAPFIVLAPPSPPSGPATVEAGGGLLTLVGGTRSIGFTLSASPAATLAPASGIISPGTPVAYSINAPAEGMYTITLANDAGLRVTAPVLFSATAAPPPTTGEGTVVLRFNGANGAVLTANEGTLGGNMLGTGGCALSSAHGKYGSAALAVPAGGVLTHAVDGDYYFVDASTFVGPGDAFTYRAWVDLTSTSATIDGPSEQLQLPTFYMDWDDSNGAGIAFFRESGTLKAKFFFGTFDAFQTVHTAVAATGYGHYEIGYSGTTVYFFVNGDLKFSSAVALGAPEGTTGGMGIISSTLPGVAYVDDFQLLIGACLHTTNFTPPGELVP